MHRLEAESIVARMTPFDELQFGFRVALEKAWESSCAGSFGVGACVTTPSGEVVATGRNRLFEQRSGDDPLAGTSLAHAEINALAKLGFAQHRGKGLILWTTLQPCVQCLGAIRLSDVTDVRVLAPDPLFRGIEDMRLTVPFLRANWPSIQERPIDEWAAFSLLLPTHVSAFWNVLPPGWDAFPILVRLARDLIEERTLIEAEERQTPLPAVVASVATRLVDAIPEIAAVAKLRPPESQ
jgi:tRNA(adenine34) deaminase